MSKYKFVYAKHKIHPKVDREYEQWYLLIDNVVSFSNFIQLRSKGLVEKYWKLKGMNKTRFGHLSDGDMIAIEQLLCFCSKERKTIVDDCFLISDLMKGYFNIFLREGKFVVSPNNAFRNVDDSFKILRTIERDDLIFPTTSYDDIRVIKWPNGTHYYAKVGNQDVVIDRKQKWDSEQEAREAGIKFLNRVGVIK